MIFAGSIGSCLVLRDIVFVARDSAFLIKRDITSALVKSFLVSCSNELCESIVKEAIARDAAAYM